MKHRVLNPLFFLIARATHDELANQLQFLKVENEILRSKLPARVATTVAERRRLVRYGKPLGSAIKELINIVSPRTFARWVNRETAEPTQPKPRGRPRTALNIEELVVRIARESGLGYTRILGELRKLGIENVCRSTVKNILDRHGIEPTADRNRGSWDQFIRTHAESLWGCDFFTKNVWTPKGLKTVYVLFALHIGSRKVRLLGHTDRPDAAWMSERARLMRKVFDDASDSPQLLLHDRDTKFTAAFDRMLTDAGHQVIPLMPYSPNLNGHAERWIQSVKRECLDHFIVFGERHLDYLLEEYAQHYNTERPHSACLHLPPSHIRDRDGPNTESTRVTCQSRLGGLLRHYHRAAA